MQFYKTVDTDNFLRIEDEEGSAVTIFYRNDLAELISIMVDEDSRGEGVGALLLTAAEQELFSMGVRTLETDFSDRLDGLSEFFKSTGFGSFSRTPIKSVDMKTLLSSLTVKRALASEIEGTSFCALMDFVLEQWDGFLSFLSHFDIRLGQAELARFVQEFSGVVYDERGTAQSFILCSDIDGAIHVDFMAALSGADPKYIMAAMRGMLKGIVDGGGFRTYSSLTMLTCNPKIEALLSKVLKKDSNLSIIGNAIYAKKDIVRIDDRGDYTIDESLDEDMEDEWRREIKRIPLQSNIGWKLLWYRAYGQAETYVKPEEAGSKRSSSHGSAVGLSNGISIPFDKDEDEREGLTMEHTVRITMDNLIDFAGDLPEYVLSDLPRPFFRGLAASQSHGDKPGAIIVWEYKNIEEDMDNEAEISYFFCDDPDLGKELIEEYTSEIGIEEVKKSSFEVETLSETEEEVLRESGFLISEGESRDIICPVSDLLDAPFSKKKPGDFVKTIGSVSEKQFKRGVSACLFHGKKGLMEDLAFVPMAWYDTDISSCVVLDNKVIGLFLIHKDPRGRLMIDLLHSVSSEYQVALLNMIRFSVRATGAKYSLDTPVVIRRHNEKLNLLIKNLFPEKTGGPAVAGERREA